MKKLKRLVVCLCVLALLVFFAGQSKAEEYYQEQGDQKDEELVQIMLHCPVVMYPFAGKTLPPGKEMKFRKIVCFRAFGMEMAYLEHFRGEIAAIKNLKWPSDRRYALESVRLNFNANFHSRGKTAFNILINEAEEKTAFSAEAFNQAIDEVLGMIDSLILETGNKLLALKYEDQESPPAPFKPKTYRRSVPGRLEERKNYEQNVVYARFWRMGLVEVGEAHWDWWRYQTAELPVVTHLFFTTFFIDDVVDGKFNPEVMFGGGLKITY